jgi:hypothetical protein
VPKQHDIPALLLTEYFMLGKLRRGSPPLSGIRRWHSIQTVYLLTVCWCLFSILLPFIPFNIGQSLLPGLSVSLSCCNLSLAFFKVYLLLKGQVQHYIFQNVLYFYLAFMNSVWDPSQTSSIPNHY